MNQETALSRLAKAIGYPEEVSSDAMAFAFSVDDGMIRAVEGNGRLVLSRELASPDDVDLALFAQYAAGRILREDAILAYDPAIDRLILWQELPASSDDSLLCRFFEVFATSCDWWLARVAGAETVSSIPEMTIRP